MINISTVTTDGCKNVPGPEDHNEDKAYDS